MKEEKGLCNIVNFESFRIARNIGAIQTPLCWHKTVVLDDKNNTLWCEDCKIQLDPFETIKRMTTEWSHLQKSMERQKEELEALKNKTLIFRAAKKVESMLREREWQPTCPHCSKPLFAEDFLNLGRVGKKFAKRQREKT